jgi:hypothetical protein
MAGTIGRSGEPSNFELCAGPNANVCGAKGDSRPNAVTGVTARLPVNRLLTAGEPLFLPVLADKRSQVLSAKADQELGVSQSQPQILGYRRSCLLIGLICLTLAWLPIALSQEMDEGEFSRPMLGYKLRILQAEFKQTEMMLSARIVALTLLKKLEHVSAEIERLEAEFQGGRCYPDLLDEQIVINREELRLIRVNVLVQKPIEI